MTVAGTVLLYHAIGDGPGDEDPHGLFTPHKVFDSQLAYLARNRNVVSLEELVDGSFARDRPAVAITFDDGYRSVLHSAAPALARYGFPAIAFVPTKWTGQYNTWDDFRGSSPPEIMDGRELVELEAAGIEVGSHGHAHIDYTAATEAEIREDVEASARSLRGLLGRSPRYLAYPWGRAPRAARLAAARSGFQAAFGVRVRDHDRYAYPRVTVGRDDSPLIFAAKTSGRYQRLRMLWPGSVIRGARLVRS